MKDASDYVKLEYGVAQDIMTETAPYVGIYSATLGNYSGPIGISNFISYFCTNVLCLFGVGWGTFYPQLQWELYKFTGDITLMQQQYQTTKGWLEFLALYAAAHNNSIDILQISFSYTL